MFIHKYRHARHGFMHAVTCDTAVIPTTAVSDGATNQLFSQRKSGLPAPAQKVGIPNVEPQGRGFTQHN